MKLLYGFKERAPPVPIKEMVVTPSTQGYT